MITSPATMQYTCPYKNGIEEMNLDFLEGRSPRDPPLLWSDLNHTVHSPALIVMNVIAHRMAQDEAMR